MTQALSLERKTKYASEPTVLKEAGSASDKINVAESERWLSLIGGGALAIYGLRNPDLLGFGAAVVGGALVNRGLTGHCPLYHSLHLSTEAHGHVAAVGADRGVRVVRATTIQRPAKDLYAIWRDFEHLPRLMSHLDSVEVDGVRSHWIAQAPLGFTVEWDAEIVTDERNRLIAWRSLSGSQIATAGSVHFAELPHDRGTEVRVELKYDPPGGKLGSWLSWLFGEEPSQQVREDLRRFKQLMEAGEIPTVAGQPSGHR